MAKDSKKEKVEEPVEEEEQEQVEQTPLAPAVSELVRDAVKSSRALAAVRPELTNVMMLLTTYVGTGDIKVTKVSRSEAFEELELIQGLNADQIESSIKKVYDAIELTYGELASDFAKETEADASGGDAKVFAKRREEEIEEQRALKGISMSVLRNIKNACGQLGIRNPDPTLAEKLDGKKKGKGAKALKSVASGLRAVGRVFVDVDSDKTSTFARASWLTDPILTDDDKEIALLKTIMARLAKESDSTRVWDALNRLKMDEGRVSALFKSLTGKARKQLEQCEEILTNVEEDYKRYDAALQETLNTLAMVNAVADFFGFSQKA